MGRYLSGLLSRYTQNTRVGGLASPSFLEFPPFRRLAACNLSGRKGRPHMDCIIMIHSLRCWVGSLSWVFCYPWVWTSLPGTDLLCASDHFLECSPWKNLHGSHGLPWWGLWMAFAFDILHSQTVQQAKEISKLFSRRCLNAWFLYKMLFIHKNSYWAYLLWLCSSSSSFGWSRWHREFSVDRAMTRIKFYQIYQKPLAK